MNIDDDVDDSTAPDETANDFLTWDLEDAPCADQRFPFGKHKGRRFCDVPISYVLWLLSQDWMWKPQARDYVQLRHAESFRATLLHFLWSQPACTWLFEATKKELRVTEKVTHPQAAVTAAPHRYSDEHNPDHQRDPSAAF